MFVTGAALALAAIVLDSASASDRRELRAVLNESAQHLVALSAPPKAEEIRQLERDNLRLVLRLGSANRVIEAHDDAVEAADTWEATPNSDAAEKDFGRQWDLFISEANKFARTEF